MPTGDHQYLNDHLQDVNTIIYDYCGAKISLVLTGKELNKAPFQLFTNDETSDYLFSHDGVTGLVSIEDLHFNDFTAKNFQLTPRQLKQ